MNADTARMHRLTLRFKDSELEQSFAEEQAHKSLRPVRITLASAGALMFFVWPAINRIAPSMQEHMPRIVVMVLATIGACYALTHTQIFLRRNQWVMLALACTMAVGVASVLHQYPAQLLEASGFYLMVIHLFSIYGLLRLRFPAATVSGLIGMAIYLVFVYPLYLFTREFSENKRTKLQNEHAPTNLLEDDVFAVVDGQQRLSSLYIGLAGSYKYKKSGKGLQNVDANFITSKLHINLFAQDTKGAEESLFQFLSHDDGAAISEKSLWFEIGHALAWGNVDHARAYVSNFLLPRVLASKKKKKLIAIFESRKEKIALKLESVYQMLHAKRLFYFDIDNQNLDEVVDVFTRVNSGGMTLKKSDLLFSILVSQWNEGRDEIGDLVESMRDSGIDISQDFVMRSCIVLSGLRVKYNLESFKTKNIKIMKGNWENIKVSLMKLCDLLPEIGYIYHPNLSDNALIPIAYYIFKGGNLNTIKAKKSLQQYYVVSQVKGIFGGQSDQVLEKFRTEIDRQLERDKFLNIKELVALKLPGGKSMTMALEDLNQLVDDTAWGSPHAYFLLSLIYPTVDFKIKRYEIDHVHPKSKFNVRNLTNNGIADQETIDDWMDWKKDCLPNLQLLADKDNAAKKAKTLIEYLNAKKPQERHLFSKENLLPPKGDKLLELASFDQFFEYRKRKLVNKLKPSFGL